MVEGEGREIQWPESFNFPNCVMDKGRRILREVKARQVRDQEARTATRIKQLQRQELEAIRIEKRVEKRLQEEKRGCLGYVCLSCLFVVSVLTCSVILVGFLASRRHQHVRVICH